jgi:hypothetical protein
MSANVVGNFCCSGGAPTACFLPGSSLVTHHSSLLLKSESVLEVRRCVSAPFRRARLRACWQPARSEKFITRIMPPAQAGKPGRTRVGLYRTKGGLPSRRDCVRLLSGSRAFGGDATMDTIEQNQHQPEETPFQQICARHGEKVCQHHGCPKCVIEEVRRHEQRIDALFQCEITIPADSIDKANALLADISRGERPE